MMRRFPWGSRELQVQMGYPGPSHRNHRRGANYLHVFFHLFQEYAAGDIGHRLRTALAVGGPARALVDLLSVLAFQMMGVFLVLGELIFHAATTKALEL